ncbi:MAG: DNA recombination protein RmuC [Caldilineaceae bacterium SB0675_bin_29]|uniref:DNA recombination protein RmuC n=1 Tax=Caldilineaceae bacterium SB0675_bin_29 TaxID=2605266 RepID=A0A6B1G0J6_9CHLR|nr:DNA recombination protein RmuC [Caldilineaceae bacterium SB0675_bin_29]
MDSNIAVIVGILVGCLLGGVAVWLVQEARAKSKLARMEADHREEKAALQGRLEEAESAEKILETAKEQLKETFQATASQALQANNSQFMDLAKENLGKTLEEAKGDFKQRHEQFEALVKPLTQNYEQLNPQISLLAKRSESLAAETGKLSSALTDNRQIGNWGEVQLRRVVELAGMEEYCDFREQAAVGDSQSRPDLTVRLPEQRTVVIDAKTSTAAYMDAQEADDRATRDSSLKRHASALKAQVDDLAKKDYGTKVEGSLGFVVMFVPGDQFLGAALNANPELIEYAMSKREAIATPASLISLLWSVANGWQRHRIAESAEVILKEGVELHDRMLRFISRYQEVGKRLKRAVDAFNESVGSFDSRVVPQARKFAQLTSGREDRFPEPQQIENRARISRYAGEQIESR